MAGVFIVFTALLLCLPDLNGIKIDQSPPSLFESPGRSAELNCSHDDSNYDKMYWYQQTRKEALELIGYQYGKIYPEEKFKERFKMTVKATEKGFVTISNLTAEDSAVYFCAASIHSPSQGIGVSQTPQVLLQGAGGSAWMFCEHDGGIDYRQMYWYRQLRGQGIQLLVFSLSGSAPQYEKDFNEERYEVNRSAVTKGSLKIKKLEPGDSALYFYSASKHSDTIPLQHLAKSTLPSLLPALVL
ncbi:UNVERIFIED_CONTAM: hypothetical protein FKN15_062059 [Acipenser sinensis]